MRKKQGSLRLVIGALALLAVFWILWELEPEIKTGQLVLQVDYGETKQDIRGWKENDDDILYFFLPSGAAHVTWKVNGAQDFRLDGVPIQDGTECVFEAGKTYLLTERSGIFRREKSGELVILQSEGVGCAFLTTDSKRMDYVWEEKGNKEGGSAVFVTAEGIADYTGSFEEIKGRGNYTWLLDKKSYSLNFSQPVELLSLAEDSQWVLLASASEETHLINRMVFEMMREAGIDDVQESAWIDLYLNGEYAGNYLLSQKIKPQEEDLDGGWMVEFDGYWEEEGKPGFYTEAGEKLAIGYPETDKEGASEEKYEAIAGFVQRVENAILSGNGTDEQTGLSWKELADADSLVKKFILDEISMCPDGWNGSNYCFLREGKLYFGPPWDYEFAFGNQPAWFSKLQHPQGLYHARETKWYKALYQKEEFLDAVRTQYRDFFEPYLRKQAQSGLDGQAKQIAASMEMDAVRWQKEQVRFWRGLDNLKNFISDRLDWLNQEWLGIEMEEETPWHELYLMDGEEEYAVHSYREGSYLDEEVLEREEENFTGWYENPECTVSAQNLSEPVTEDIYLYSGWDDSIPRRRMLIQFMPLILFLGALMALTAFSLFPCVQKKRPKP